MLRKVLVVEDDPNTQVLIVSILRSAGFEVDTAADGQEAFRKGTTGRYDLVTLDLVMEPWSGEQAIDSLSFIEANVPTIIVTAIIDPEVRSRLLSNPSVKGFIEKPFTREQLLKAVNEAISD
ncbi:MAG: response regulator [Planctomycetes bacterium]|nr:response regulator [Planctomycetota bacterium]